MMTQYPTKQPPITADDIHAYVDGVMATDRIAHFEAYLAENPSEAAKVADYRAINQTLNSAFHDVITEPVPNDLLDAVHRKHRFPLSQVAAALVWPSAGAGMRIAASMAWLALGLGVGSYANDSLSPRTDAFARLTQEAQTAYTVYAPEKLHPVEVRAAQSDHLSSWLSNRLGRNIPIPSLMDLGYSLVGGRLLTGYQKPAAMLMYQDTKGQRIILYVSTELGPDENAPMAFDHAQGAGVITWAHGGTGFGVAGGGAKDDLMPAANLIRAQISI